MPEADALLDQARLLGKAIAAHPRIRAYDEAQRALQNDADARKLLDEYQQAVRRIHELEAQRKPIEPEDKRRLADCEQRMASNEALQTFVRTQVDYLDLMHRINQAMEEPLVGLLSAAEH